MFEEKLIERVAPLCVEPPPTEVYEKCAHTFPKDYCPLCKEEELEALKKRIECLECEISRLKGGKFTEDELQNLCHNLDSSQCKSFLKGCRSYQVSLFGSKMVREELHTLYKEWVNECACRECGSVPDPDGLVEHNRSCTKYGVIDRVDVVWP